MTSRARWISFAIVLLLVTALTAGFVVRAVAAQHRRSLPTTATVQDQALDLGSVLAQSHIVFRSMAIGPTYGMMAAVPLSDPGGPRSVSTQECERVYSTATAGICLSADRGAVTTYQGALLNAQFAPIGTVPVNGAPSRARLSSDGSISGTTVFTAGQGYGTIGFSTETRIYDRATRHSYGNLEKTFAVMIDGKRTTAVDLNIWGVTFQPGNRPTTFYATVATGGLTWLARGDLQTRTLTAIHQDAECPSISPDGRTIVFKRRDGSKIKWRYHALDLVTGAQWDLPETRSVDDQAEWLDDKTIVYGLQQSGTGKADIWTVPVRGTTQPRILIPNAFSPAVVRQPAAAVASGS
jgi:hypothetical protein